MALPKLREKKNLWDPNCGNAIAENREKKKICETLIVAMALPKLGEKKILWAPNCGNAIAEIGGKKILFWQLWQWHCRKWKRKKKCYKICERVKKKLSRP